MRLSVRQSAELGMMVSLLSHGPTYRKWTVGDIERRLCAPLLLNQYKVYCDDDHVVGFFTWAWWDTERGEHFVNTKNVPHGHWNNGDDLWIPDIVVPFGHFHSVARDIKGNMFPNYVMYSCREHTQRIHRYIGDDYAHEYRRKAA